MNIKQQIQKYIEQREAFVASRSDSTSDMPNYTKSIFSNAKSSYQTTQRRDVSVRSDSISDMPPPLLGTFTGQKEAYVNSIKPPSATEFLSDLSKSLTRSVVDQLGNSIGVGLDDLRNPRRLANAFVENAKQEVTRGVTRRGNALANNLREQFMRGIRKSEDGSPKMREEEINGVRDLYYNLTIGDLRAKTQSELDLMSISRHSRIDTKFRIDTIDTKFNSMFEKTYVDPIDTPQSTTDDTDYIIKFDITNENKSLLFRMANFTGLTDSLTTTYDDATYIGRPERYPSYTGTSRNITFTFGIFADDKDDIDVIYKKLNALASLSYPHSYTSTNIMQPNIIKLSIGRYLIDKPFFIQSSTFIFDEDLVHSEGKPRGMSITINGTLLQSESNPKLYDITLGTPKFLA